MNENEQWPTEEQVASLLNHAAAIQAEIVPEDNKALTVLCKATHMVVSTQGLVNPGTMNFLRCVMESAYAVGYERAKARDPYTQAGDLLLKDAGETP